MLTLTAWIYVYEMRVEKSPVSMLFFDSSNNQTTGNDFYDGMVSYLLFALVIADVLVERPCLRNVRRNSIICHARLCSVRLSTTYSMLVEPILLADHVLCRVQLFLLSLNLF
jgi:hypothetical protein